MTNDYQDAKHSNTLYHLNHLTSIEVSGDDAGLFLQGQLTCDINELSDSKANIAAFCNAKGRVISTLLIVKTQASFLLILPLSLLEKVLKKLQMYVLRSKVQLVDKSSTYSLIGLYCTNPLNELSLPTTDFQCNHSDDLIDVKLPSISPRFLCIIKKFSHMNSFLESFARGDCKDWRYQDISSGFPWFDINQAEKYIPQMLNIDQLGGISYNKGCYVGQEIIARTHYLGKTKRHLCLVECQRGLELEIGPDLAVLSANTQEKMGEILDLQTFGKVTRMLVVLQTVDEEIKNLILDNIERTPLAPIPFQ